MLLSPITLAARYTRADILQMLSMLPHPLPERLPPIYDPGHVHEPSTLTFVDYVKAQDEQVKADKAKRRREMDESGIGLGLDLDGQKRHKSDDAEGSASDSPETARLRGETKDKWSRERWSRYQQE
jgi:hypothetical protein